MAVKRVTEVSPDRAGDKEKLQGRYTRIFQVETNDRGDGPNVAIAAIGVQIGDPYIYRNEVNAAALAQNIRAAHGATTSQGDVWEVTVDYSDKFDLGSGGPGQQDPTNFFPDVSWSHRSRFKVILKDQLDQLIVNSAGDPFDPPLEIELCNAVLRVERYESVFYENRIPDLVGKTNDAPFKGFEEGEARLREYGGQQVFLQGKRLWRVTYEIEFQIGGWDEEILDQGFRELIQDADGTRHLEPMHGANNEPVSQPDLLNGFGGKKRPEEAPVFLVFQTIERVDFGRLNLENI